MNFSQSPLNCSNLATKMKLQFWQTIKTGLWPKISGTMSKILASNVSTQLVSTLGGSRVTNFSRFPTTTKWRQPSFSLSYRCPSVSLWRVSMHFTSKTGWISSSNLSLKSCFFLPCSAGWTLSLLESGTWRRTSTLWLMWTPLIHKHWSSSIRCTCRLQSSPQWLTYSWHLETIKMRMEQ